VVGVVGDGVAGWELWGGREARETVVDGVAVVSRPVVVVDPVRRMVALTAVRRACDAARKDLADRDRAIVAAARLGCSPREIAVAGRFGGHSGVQKILRRLGR